MFDDSEVGVGIGRTPGANPQELAAIISRLSPSELDDLEDDLDFCVFSGVPSVRILAIMDRLGALEGEWRELLKRKTERAA